MDFTIGHGAVLDAARDDEELPRFERHVALAHLYGELDLGHEEQFVGVVVRMPSELALELDHLDLVFVQPGHRLGRPKLGEQRQLLGNVNRTVRHGVKYRS